MSQEIPDSRSCAPRTRRVYSAQFKAELIAACQQPGASIAATAREHGMNANVLHRWLKEHRQGLHPSACDTAHAVVCGIAPHCDDAAAEPMADPQPVCDPAHQAHPVPANPVPAFIAMTMGSQVMGPRQRVHMRPHQCCIGSCLIRHPHRVLPSRHPRDGQLACGLLTPTEN